MLNGSSMTNQMLCSPCHATISPRFKVPVSSTITSSDRLTGISYDTIIATVRMAPRRA